MGRAQGEGKCTMRGICTVHHCQRHKLGPRNRHSLSTSMVFLCRVTLEDLRQTDRRPKLTYRVEKGSKLKFSLEGIVQSFQPLQAAYLIGGFSFGISGQQDRAPWFSREFQFKSLPATKPLIPLPVSRLRKHHAFFPGQQWFHGAGDGADVAAWPLPTSGPVRCEFPAVVPPAYPSE